MKSKRVFALIALILGVAGGVLLVMGFISALPRLLDGRAHFAAESLVFVGVGAVTIIASEMIWKESYLAGGLINIVLGVITVFYGKDAEGLVILVSGVLGTVAPQIKN